MGMSAARIAMMMDPTVIPVAGLCIGVSAILGPKWHEVQTLEPLFLGGSDP